VDDANDADVVGALVLELDDGLTNEDVDEYEPKKFMP
jgi:hypothetical protein